MISWHLFIPVWSYTSCSHIDKVLWRFLISGIRDNYRSTFPKNCVCCLSGLDIIGNHELKLKLVSKTRFVVFLLIVNFLWDSDNPANTTSVSVLLHIQSYHVQVGTLPNVGPAGQCRHRSHPQHPLLHSCCSSFAKKPRDLQVSHDFHQYFRVLVRHHWRRSPPDHPFLRIHICHHLPIQNSNSWQSTPWALCLSVLCILWLIPRHFQHSFCLQILGYQWVR